MKKKFVLFFIFIFFVSACSNAKTLQITDPAKPILVNAGAEFTIVIESNPTTGYHWEIENELDTLEFVSKDYQASQPISIGSGGVDVWTFKAISAGETQITLGYYSPSNLPEPAQQTVTFIVTVK